MDLSLRQELSETTFEELLQIRDKLGTKAYRETILNQFQEEKSQHNRENHRGSMRSREINEKPNQIIRSQPIEASSKRSETKYNFMRIMASDDLVRKKKQQPKLWDPRFESKAGQFRNDKFEQNYAFIGEMRKQELRTLQKQLKKTKNEDSKNQIRFLIQRLNNQVKSEDEKKQIKELVHIVQRKVAKAKNIEPKISQPVGQQTQTTRKNNLKSKIFVNKSLVKQTRMVEKYKQLKQSGQLQKYIEKKRKKNLMKDRKKFSIE